jgi:hypothetical protein
LKRIYRLCRSGNEPASLIRPAAVEDLRPAESLIELASASFRFDPSDRIRNRCKFDFLRKVVALVPVKRLVVPNDFAMLPAVHDLIVKDLAGETPARARA